MADLIALENSAIPNVANDKAETALSLGFGSLMGRVQKARENFKNISGQDIVDHVKQRVNNVRNISREDIVNKVKQTGENLRNTKPEDVGFLFASIGAGLSAKALAVGGLGLLGVTTGGVGIAAILAGATVAVAGGAAAGIAKAGVKHIRAVKNGSKEKFFNSDTLVSRDALMTAAYGIGISALTFGFSEVFEHVTGHSIGETLGKAFHKVADPAVAKFAHSMDVQAQGLNNVQHPTIATITDEKPVFTAMAQDQALRAQLNNDYLTHFGEAAPENMTPEQITTRLYPENPAAYLKSARELADYNLETGKVDLAPAVQTTPEVNLESATEEVVQDPIPETPQIVSITSAPEVTPASEVEAIPEPVQTVEAPAFNGDVVSGNHPRMSASLHERAMAWLRKLHPAAKVVPDAPSADAPSAPAVEVASDPLPTPAVAHIAPDNAVPKPIAAAPVAQPTPHPATGKTISPSNASPRELAEQAIAKAKLALTQEELTNHYTLERLQEMVKTTTGIDAPADATAETLAKQLYPNNSDAFLKGIQQQAPQIKVENLAASCAVELPKEKSTVNVIKTLCYKFKEHMGSNDIALVDNVGEADPKKGISVLYSRAAKAFAGVMAKESTQDFIAGNISGPNGVVQEIAEAKLGL